MSLKVRIGTGIKYKRPLGTLVRISGVREYRYRTLDLIFCLYFSAVDTDLHGFALIWMPWVRIRIGNADPDLGTWKLTQAIK
jgi:hypothetical protein